MPMTRFQPLGHLGEAFFRHDAAIAFLPGQRHRVTIAQCQGAVLPRRHRGCGKRRLAFKIEAAAVRENRQHGGSVPLHGHRQPERLADPGRADGEESGSE